MERTCTCGHDESAHYTYCLNGHDQTRCKECDPFTGLRQDSTNVEMQHGSYVAAMYVVADHNFEDASGE